MENVKRSIIELVVFPLQHPELFTGKLLRPPKGILLYGPPGTGKTMMAKAIAKQSGARFINLSQSTLQNKWFGESVKLVRAVFKLAVKLQVKSCRAAVPVSRCRPAGQPRSCQPSQYLH